MKKATLICLCLSILIVSGLYCSSPYKINQELPEEGVDIQTLFPTSIDDVSAIINCNDIENEKQTICSAEYEGIGRITAAGFETDDNALNYFNFYCDNIDTKTKTSMGANEQHWANYTENSGNVGFAWRLHNWMFDVNGIDQENLDKLINSFDYLSAN